MPEVRQQPRPGRQRFGQRQRQLAEERLMSQAQNFVIRMNKSHLRTEPGGHLPNSVLFPGARQRLALNKEVGRK